MRVTVDKAGPGPQLVRRGERLVARPRVVEGERAEIDVAQLIEEERSGGRVEGRKGPSSG